MFRLYKNGEIIGTFDSREDVLTAKDGHSYAFMRFSWFTDEPAKPDFGSLNVTGNDIMPCARFRSWWNPDFGCFEYAQTRNSAPVLRPYRVTEVDNSGRERTVDIRAWKSEVDNVLRMWNIERKYRYSNEPEDVPEHARQLPFRRAKAPSLTRAALAEIECFSVNDEELEYRPMKARVVVRKRGIDRKTVGDEYGFYLPVADKCWKGSSKSGRQYAKKKPGCTRRQLTSDRWAALAEWM